MFKNVFEEKGEIIMYDKLLIYLQTIFGRPESKHDNRAIPLIKINKKAIQSLIDLMLKNRDYFMRLLRGIETKDKDLMQKPTGEFFIDKFIPVDNS